ncbi:MAG: hypothetical protein ABIS30_10915 [Gallionella sp.]|jgi:hypothetical protein
MLIEAPYVPVHEALLVMMQAVHAGGNAGAKGKTQPFTAFFTALLPLYRKQITWVQLYL